MVPKIAEAIRRDIPAWFAEQEVRKTLETVPLSEITQKLHLASKETSKSMGVFCLAEHIDSVLMWSHYASNHTGIAIQFDFRGQTRCDLLPIWKVRYQSKRPIIRDLHSSNPELPIADALAIKADFWRYEGEWRAMKPNRAGTFIQFDPKIITGIVFGANCSATDQQLARKICEGHSVEFQQMETDFETFALSVVAADGK